jgi:hypothetical protein
MLFWPMPASVSSPLPPKMFSIPMTASVSPAPIANVTSVCPSSEHLAQIGA